MFAGVVLATKPAEFTIKGEMAYIEVESGAGRLHLALCIRDFRASVGAAQEALNAWDDRDTNPVQLRRSL